MKKMILFFYTVLISFPATAQLKVITTTMNLYSLTKSIGRDKISPYSFTKGPQDPHFQEAKPSYMRKAKEADLLVFIGMDLEVGWLSNIIDGSRNPRIQEEQAGHLPASRFIQALSVPDGKVDRFFGDVHPFGNPHYMLDPLRALKVAKGIQKKLSEIDPKNKQYYKDNYKSFEKHIKGKMREWRKRIRDSGVKNIVTYHSSFEYFLERFQLNLTGTVEEKPGIPPSAKYILKLTEKMEKDQCSCILTASFYGGKWMKKFKKTRPVHIETTAIEVGALKPAKGYTLMIEGIVRAVENCGAFIRQKKDSA